MSWFDTAQSAVEDDMDHAEMEELIYAAQRSHCCYSDGAGDDGNPAFALIRIDGGWTAVCAYHAHAAAAGEMKSWTPDSGEDAVEIEPRDLWDAVDRLTNPTRKRLLRDGVSPEWLTVPSLWVQLCEAVESGSGSKSRSVQRSQAPLDVSALALKMRIVAAVADGCHRASVQRKGLLDVPRDLRSLVSALIRAGDQDTLATTLKLLRSWANQIRATISNDPDRTWRMHGAACQVCASTTVPVWNDDGEETRQPALIVHSADGVIDKVECGFCGSTLTGPDLTRLLFDTLKKTDADRTAEAG